MHACGFGHGSFGSVVAVTETNERKNQDRKTNQQEKEKQKWRGKVICVGKQLPIMNGNVLMLGQTLTQRKKQKPPLMIKTALEQNAAVVPCQKTQNLRNAIRKLN